MQEQESLIRDSDVRLWIYRHFVDTGRAPSPVEIAAHFQITPVLVEAVLHRLQDEADGLLLLPGSSYLWMAEPFSAVPTSFLVRSGARQWWGNCIWDALAILALLGVDGSVSTACPHSGEPLHVAVTNGGPSAAPGIVHFAVPARDWWRDIGFFAVSGGVTDQVGYSSSEGANPPQLLVIASGSSVQAAGPESAEARAPGEPEAARPSEAILLANHPNPFDAGTTIHYSLPQATQVRLVVYDLAGRAVRTLADGVEPAGEQRVQWDGRDASGASVRAGIYILRLEAGGMRLTRKMSVMR